ncbi:MAG: hypothetical protein WBA31_07260 [Candidatus Dormiibacterota bacterium]
MADGLKHSREASALLTAAVGSVSQVQDPEVRELALAALEAVGRLEARVELLDEAYRIADRHRASDFASRSGRSPSRPAPVTLIGPSSPAALGVELGSEAATS